MAQKAKSGGKSTAAKGKNSSSSKKSTAAAKNNSSRPIRREVASVVCLFLGIFSVIGYFNVDAWFINIFCGFIKALIGWGYYLFPPAMLFCAFILAFHHGKPVALRVTFALLAPVFLGAFACLFSRADYETFKNLLSALWESGRSMNVGGVISGLLGEGLVAAVSVYGAFPVLLAAIIISLIIALKLDLKKLVSNYKNRPKLEYEPEPEPEPVSFTQVEVSKKPSKRRAAIDIPIDGEAANAPEEGFERKAGFFNKTPRVRTPDQVISEQESNAKDIPIKTEPVPAKTETLHSTAARTAQNRNVEPLTVEQAAEIAGISIDSTDSASVESNGQAKSEKPSAEEVRQETEQISREIEEGAQQEQEEYRYPPLDLLQKPVSTMMDGREEIALNCERLNSAIHSFGVSARIVGTTRGPTVTRYDVELDSGVKLNKITNLANDLALALGVESVRISPIPDMTSTVGLEVPNKLVSTVYLREIIESQSFVNASSKISVSIGKDIGGNCIVGNIGKMPHLLIAGTTGSGKSVCMNSLILSILFKATPDEVRLIMIDPKMVELGIYNGIPHLYIPVVTDPKKAAGSLQWAVIEMLKRYRLFSEVGARDLETYNEHQKKIGEPTLPEVVIVIDELADLMVVASKDVESSICRIAQMGRASGMHLIIATQRPSADVITGLMKANIPSRIAFSVSSALESRIILESGGAEKLLGNGDMLFKRNSGGKALRVQGTFVTDEEREKVIDFIKQGSSANYSDEIIAEIEKVSKDSDNSGSSGSSRDSGASSADPFADYDDLLPQAVDVILETKQASTSMLQRRLKLGYSRAARLIDQLEEIGVVGPYEGSKPRQLLITREQWLEMQMVNGTAPTENVDDMIDFTAYEDAPEDDWE